MKQSVSRRTFAKAVGVAALGSSGALAKDAAAFYREVIARNGLA